MDIVVAYVAAAVVASTQMVDNYGILDHVLLVFYHTIHMARIEVVPKVAVGAAWEAGAVDAVDVAVVSVDVAAVDAMVGFVAGMPGVVFVAAVAAVPEAYSEVIHLIPAHP